MIAGIKQGGGPKRGGGSGGTRGRGKEIQMIGISGKPTKTTNTNKEPCMKEVLSSPRKGDFEPMVEPMIIVGEVGDHVIHWIYVDNARASKIMFESEDATSTTKVLHFVGWFCGESVMPLGQVCLPFTLGSNERYER